LIGLREDRSSPCALRIWRGDLVSRRRLEWASRFLVLPGIAWIIIFFALPTALLMLVAFASRSATGGIDWTFTWSNFAQLAGFGPFGWSPANLVILVRSLWIALLTTAGCAVLGYPLAFFIATRPSRSRTWWLVVLTVPFWTNLIVRTYAWLIVLGPESPIARVAAALGLVPAGAPLYPGTFATCLGMVSAFLPFMVMPLYAAVEKLDWSLIEAANDLYASRWRVFRHAILPQTAAAFSVGVILTFIPAMGMFLVSDILGGARFMLVGNLIQLQFGFGSGNPAYAAALALVLIVFTLVLAALLARLGGKKEDLV
jgi:spermidine/putrescine transport system permease protein